MGRLEILIISAALLFHVAQGLQELQAHVAMKGVKATVTFTASGNDVTATVMPQDDSLTGQVGIEVRATMTEYFVKDKCTTSQIGNAVQSMKNLSIPNSKTATWNGQSLQDFEGRSVLLTQGPNSYCATIQISGNYTTARAEFLQGVFGIVYFRQSMESNSPTIITSTLYSANIKHPSVLGIWTILNGACRPSVQSTSSIGSIMIGNTTSGTKYYQRSTTVQLMGSDSINGKSMVLKLPSGGTLACAPVHSYAGKTAVSRFSRDGVQGTFTFTQKSPLDVTFTDIDLTGLNHKAGGYHVHLWPVPIQTAANQPLCSPAVVSGHLNPFNIPIPYQNYTTLYQVLTDDLFEVGDLSSKYGNLSDKGDFDKKFTDLNLPLYGVNSIVGRSVVIHRNDIAKSRWVCSTIVLQDYLVSATATFQYPAIGHVVFTQVKDSPMSETSVYVNLGYIDNRTATNDQKWQINDNPAGSDMTFQNASRCTSTGSIFNPLNFDTTANEQAFCNKATPLSCAVGDLSGKNGMVSIATNGSFQKEFYTDAYIPLSDSNSILGKSVIIMGQTNDIVACATIVQLRQPKLESHLDMNGISGTVNFSQKPGYGNIPVEVNINLSGFDASTMKLSVNELPPQGADCATVGSVYNPLGATGTITQNSTHDQYPIGDLSRGGSNKAWYDLNLPLQGERSVRGRSLVVTDSSSNVKACAPIKTKITSANYQEVEAEAIFTGTVTGKATLYQIIYPDGTMSDTTITLNLLQPSQSETQNHNWHTHVYPVMPDPNAGGTCVVAGGHYDPFMAKKGYAATYYSTQCKGTNPLRCELGDQAGKVGTYNLGGGLKVYTDVDLPLDGDYSVLGRSLVLHVANRGAPRQACADIIPKGRFPLEITLNAPLKVKLRDIAARYANVIPTASQNVVVQYKSETSTQITLYVYFVGLERSVLRARFKVKMEDKDVRKNLGAFNPTSIKSIDQNDNSSSAGTKVPFFFIAQIIFLQVILR